MLKNKPEIIAQLQKLVDKNVKHWKEDFNLDRERIAAKKNALPMVFLTRQCGTLLVSFAALENWTAEEIADYCQQAKTCLAYYINDECGANFKAQIYLVYDGEVKATRRNTCLKKAFDLIDRNKAQLLKAAAAD